MNNDYLNDPEFQELIWKYLRSLNDELPLIKQYIFESNFIELRQFGHNLKGTGGAYGYDSFTDYGDKINCAAHEKDIPFIKSLVADFEIELIEAIKSFNTSN